MRTPKPITEPIARLSEETMRHLGTFNIPFPERGERGDWEPDIQHYALGIRVLAVARTRVEGTWAAYIDRVPGQDHHDERAEVLLHGSKLSEQIARVLFTTYEGVPYAH